MENNNDLSPLSKILFVSILVLMVIAGLIYFSELLQPIVLAIIFWYIIKALEDFIGRIKIKGKQLPRWLRGTIAIVIIFLSLQTAIDIIVTNLSRMVNNFSIYESSLNQFLNQMGDLFRVENITDVVKKRISELDIQSYLQGILASLTSFVGNIFLVIIYVVFLFLEEVSLSKKSKMIFSDPKRIDRMKKLTQQIYSSTNQYVTLKTYVSLLTGAFSYIILLLYGVDYAFLWAFIIFLLNFIPYIGSFIATFLPAIFAIVQFGTIWYFIWIFGSIQVVQLVVGNYIEPRVMGKSLNLSPLVVVITLSFWGYVWGLLGMFLSVPITSIMLIVMAQFPSTRPISVILSENGEIDSLIVKPEEDLASG